MDRTQRRTFKISHCDSTILANPAQTCRTHRHALTHGEWSFLWFQFYSLWCASLAHMQSNWKTGDSFPINSKNCWLLKWKQRTIINDKTSTTQSCCRSSLNLLHLKKIVFHVFMKIGRVLKDGREGLVKHIRHYLSFDTVHLHILLKWFIQVDRSVNTHPRAFPALLTFLHKKCYNKIIIE